MSRPRYIFALTACLVVLVAAGSRPACAQSSWLRVDGVSAGVGLSVFVGDLDGVTGIRPMEQVGASNLYGYLGVDRSMSTSGRLRGGLRLAYHRLTRSRETLDEFRVAVDAHLAAVDLTASYDVGLVEPGFLRLYLGAGPALVRSSFDDFPSVVDLQDTEHGYDASTSRLLFTTPFGFAVQDRIRVGLRLTWTDYLDGTAYEASGQDVLGMVSLGYRFGD